jgi:signal transduction histidine kinase
MESLITELMALSQGEERVSSTEPVELAAVAETCWQTVRTGEATLETETDRHLQADRSRLRQLLENLIRNAVEHGSTSPDSTSRQDAVERGDGELTVTVGDLESGFYVADDGPGIPPDERDAVFDAGYSTTDDGTGLGLRIVRQVAETHEWTVSLTASEAGGARFEISGVDVRQ